MKTNVIISKKLIQYNIKRLENKFQKMKEYLILKIEEEDWHGVADAAMDIREIMSELKTYESLK